jgi:hypothetical protein
MTKLKFRVGRGDTGSALLVALMAASLLAALGLALAGLGTVETAIASNHRAAAQLAYAAEAGAEGVLAELLTISPWTDILSGVVSSAFAGSTVPPIGPGDPPLTLAQLTAAFQLEYGALGSWGSNTPHWRLFGHGWLTELAPIVSGSGGEFLAMFVADDIADGDGDPLVDSNDRIQIAARARNARGGQRTVLVTVERTTSLTPAGLPGVRVLSWREFQ